MMGYFKRPIRRSKAQSSWRRFLEPAREMCGDAWQLCDPSIKPAADSFLRFVVERPRLGKVGLFQSSKALDKAEELPAAARSELRKVFRWFNANLPVPRRLPRNAVCWMRADAHESLAQLRTLVEFYRIAGHPVFMQATCTPGRVVYRDAFQVAAVSYPDRRTTSSGM